MGCIHYLVGSNYRLICLAYKPYFFSQWTIFFSHDKSANSTFRHGLSAKRTGQKTFVWSRCSPAYYSEKSVTTHQTTQFWGHFLCPCFFSSCFFTVEAEIPEILRPTTLPCLTRGSQPRPCSRLLGNNSSGSPPLATELWSRTTVA